MANYSRRSNTQQKKNIRKAFVFGLLTIGVLLIFLFFGLPTVARFAAFLTDLRSSSQPVEINDTTPPAPPRISEPAEYTSKTAIDIKGTTEPGANVIIYANGDEEEVLSNKGGEFTFEWELLDGENRIYAKAKDAAGNESQESEVHIVTYDNEAPDLTVSSPENGKTFYGSSERQITIEGLTEEGSSVTINDRLVVVNAQGEFTFATTLSDGENTFNIKATDRAGNTKETTLSVNYSS
jgi:bacillopeptidase F